MKTIIITFVDKTSNVSDSFIKLAIANNKMKVFNTDADLSEGDILESPEYEGGMQVLRVINPSFIYYNTETRELSNEYSSLYQIDIKELDAQEKPKKDVSVIRTYYTKK